jgi:hypothetical protein
MSEHCAAELNGMERCTVDHLARGVACEWCAARAKAKAGG